MNDSDNGPWIIGAIAGLLLAAYLLVNGRHAADAPAQPQAITVPAITLLESDVTHLQAPSEAAASADNSVRSHVAAGTVYECSRNGVREFSDAPCGAGSITRVIGPINVMDAPKPRYHSSAPSRSNVVQVSTADDSATQNVDCTLFEQAVERIDERMRQRYSNAEGELLREHWRNAVSARDDCTRNNRLR